MALLQHLWKLPQNSCRNVSLALRQHLIRAGPFRQHHAVVQRIEPCLSSKEKCVKTVSCINSPNVFQTGSVSLCGQNPLHLATLRLLSTSSRDSGFIKFAAADEPAKESLIYSGPLSSMVRIIKFFSLSTSIISSGLLVVLCASQETGVLTYVAGGLSSIVILTPIILHWFTKGYITRMYYDFPSKTYTAFTYDFVLSDVKMDFARSDVSLPAVTSVVSSFAIRGKPVLVDPRGFLNPNHYSHLMGYTDVEGDISVEDAKKVFESSASDESKS